MMTPRNQVDSIDKIITTFETKKTNLKKWFSNNEDPMTFKNDNWSNVQFTSNQIDVKQSSLFDHVCYS